MPNPVKAQTKDPIRFAKDSFGKCCDHSPRRAVDGPFALTNRPGPTFFRSERFFKPDARKEPLVHTEIYALTGYRCLERNSLTARGEGWKPVHGSSNDRF